MAQVSTQFPNLNDVALESSSNTCMKDVASHPNLHTTITPNNMTMKNTPNTNSTENNPKSSDRNGKTRKGLIIFKFIVTILLWACCLGFFTYYVYDSVIGYMASLPVTSLSYTEQDSMDYPAISICNFNAIYHCDTCNISLVKVTAVNHTTGLMEDVSIPHVYSEFDQSGSLFRCIVFNNQSQSFNKTSEVGFPSTYSMFFSVPSMPLERNNRNGIQISFHTVGSVPDMYGETNFAIEGIDNMYILTKTRTVKLKPSKEYPTLETVRWTYKRTAIDLTRKIPGQVVVSVSYGSLSEKKNKEVNTSTLEKLLGEISAVLVALMGVDGLKVFNAIIELGYSFKHRSLMNVWNIFNKGRWY